VSYPRLLLAAALAVVGLALPGAVSAGANVTQPLIATVGSATTPEAFRISLTDSTGAKVSHLDPGTYTINVRDYATTHNFHLSGPGVNKGTDIDTTAMTTWVVTFRNGTYTYVCEAHPTIMRGSFTVGTVVTPPPVKKLVARVGPRSTISLRTASGARVKRLTAGRYRITVTDTTTADNFHLIGSGINRKTGVKFRGTRTWTVTFRSGPVRYRSDAHERLHGSFSVVAAG
jgi:hypothetical protein